MAKVLAVFLAAFFVFSGCSKKPAEPDGGAVQLPDLGISIDLPEGLEPAAPEQLQELQATTAGLPPILPFADLPRYQFNNPAAGMALLASQLTIVDPEAEKLDPVTLMEEYRKNLAAYYKTGPIAANELIRGDFRIMSMNFLYEPGDKTVYVTKVLYHRYPQHYFMIDLFIHGEGARPEDIKKFDDALLSIQALALP
jgi:hypothetical protein